MNSTRRWLELNFFRLFQRRHVRLGILLVCALMVRICPLAGDPPTTAGGGNAVGPAKVPPPGIEASTVKIFSNERYPDVFRPWQKGAPREETGSGVVIEGKRILTTYRTVWYSNDIQIQANQGGDKVSATVEMASDLMDLAVLKLSDESFFDSHPPLPRTTGIPSIKDPIFVYGYPVGGTNLSITKGIISRIEFTQYGVPSYGLKIQIDAALNAGNRGGPAVAGNKMVGMALEHLGGTDNIGYIVPNEEIELFLGNLPAGKYTNKPGFYDYTHPLQNSALRPFLKLAKTDQGTLIEQIDRDDPSYPLKKWDLIARVGHYLVDDQGMVHEGEMRLDYRYAIQKETADGMVSMEIVRDGKHLQLQVPIPKSREMVIPGVGGAYPPYFIFGPLAFTKVTQNFATALIHDNNNVARMTWDASPVLNRRGDRASFPGEEIVVVPSPFFSSKLGEGYGQPSLLVVDTVNEVPVRNLAHLVTLIRDARTDYITIRFVDRNKEQIVIPRNEALESTEQILSDNGVRAQASPELLAIWNAKPSP